MGNKDRDDWQRAFRIDLLRYQANQIKGESPQRIKGRNDSRKDSEWGHMWKREPVRKLWSVWLYLHDISLSNIDADLGVVKVIVFIKDETSEKILSSVLSENIYI